MIDFIVSVIIFEFNRIIIVWSYCRDGGDYWIKFSFCNGVFVFCNFFVSYGIIYICIFDLIIEVVLFKFNIIVGIKRW